MCETLLDRGESWHDSSSVGPACPARNAGCNIYQLNVDDTEGWNIDCLPNIRLPKLSQSTYNINRFYET